jgi:hypothetical protein
MITAAHMPLCRYPAELVSQYVGERRHRFPPSIAARVKTQPGSR